MPDMFVACPFGFFYAGNSVAIIDISIEVCFINI